MYPLAQIATAVKVARGGVVRNLGRRLRSVLAVNPSLLPGQEVVARPRKRNPVPLPDRGGPIGNIRQTELRDEGPRKITCRNTAKQRRGVHPSVIREGVQVSDCRLRQRL